jgi:multidrug transporter EmrE-like cation transporter
MGIRPGAILENITALETPRPSFRFSKAQTLGLVFCCTIFGAAAQILIKMGASTLNSAGVWAMLTNLHLMTGYSLYGFSTILLILALRDGELSILYPVISLTFVWVTFLSSYIFRETLTVTKLLGISIIVSGVAVLGMGSKR